LTVRRPGDNRGEQAQGNQAEEDVPVAMSRAEAGRKGGLTTKKRYGADFYQRIGRKGGKKGGLTTKQRYGPAFYRSIGRKGGSR
jgi:general stress protein YciG